MAVCNGTPFTVEKISPRAGIELGTARSVGQRLKTWKFVISKLCNPYLV